MNTFSLINEIVFFFVQHFAEMQESARKDVERVFSVLSEKFAMIKNPARLWNKHDLAAIMRCCIILHNMIIEDQRDTSTHFEYGSACVTTHNVTSDETDFGTFLARFEKVHDVSRHHQLQNDLIEHLWKVKGEEN